MVRRNGPRLPKSTRTRPHTKTNRALLYFAIKYAMYVLLSALNTIGTYIPKSTSDTCNSTMHDRCDNIGAYVCRSMILYLVVAGLASLGEGLVLLQSLLSEQRELLHVHQLQRQVQSRLQLLNLPQGHTNK